MSTDAIREIMRAMDTEHEAKALHRSSFSKGDSGEPVLDWNETCLAVEPGIVATIERARREGIDLLIEGVHIVPSARLLRAWEEAGGVALGVVMVVDEERAHQDMLKSATHIRIEDRIVIWPILGGSERCRRVSLSERKFPNGRSWTQLGLMTTSNAFSPC